MDRLGLCAGDLQMVFMHISGLALTVNLSGHGQGASLSINASQQLHFVYVPSWLAQVSLNRSLLACAD